MQYFFEKIIYFLSLSLYISQLFGTKLHNCYKFEEILLLLFKYLKKYCII